MAAEPKITALAPWMGSKRTMAPRIVELLGPHDGYYEPFCGSMAVLLAKPPVRHEVVNDLHGDLTNVAWVLQDRKLSARLLGRLHNTIASELHYRACRGRLLKPFAADPARPDWHRAYDALVAWWLGRNGVAGTKQTRTTFSARYTKRGGSGGVRFRAMVESVPWFIERLGRVDVLNKCGLEVLSKIGDESKTAIYCDSPYVVKSGEYAHDFKPEDHDRLAAEANRFRRARIVLSYYPHERLDSLYPADRWERVEVAIRKNLANSVARRDGAAKATELLLVNRNG